MPSPQRPGETAMLPHSRPRGLAFTVPFDVAERLVVLGASPSVVNSAQAAGAETLSLLTPAQADAARLPAGEILQLAGTERLPLPDGYADHLIVPRLRPYLLPFVPQELARILRPGGGLFLGAPSRWRQPRRPEALSVGSGARMLQRAGFDDVHAFAIRHDLLQPRHLVSIAAPEALRWYVRSAYLPASAPGALATRLLVRLGPHQSLLVLFPATGFAARRAHPRRAA
ncbi:MAG: hypothetical protein ACRDU8_01195 [Egibacteraceae bacterium]